MAGGMRQMMREEDPPCHDATLGAGHRDTGRARDLLAGVR
jgi:hypothetical protein